MPSWRKARLIAWRTTPIKSLWMVRAIAAGNAPDSRPARSQERNQRPHQPGNGASHGIDDEPRENARRISLLRPDRHPAKDTSTRCKRASPHRPSAISTAIHRSLLARWCNEPDNQRRSQWGWIKLVRIGGSSWREVTVAGVLSAATPDSLPTQHRLCMVVLSPCTASSCQDWCDVNHPGTTGICGQANCCNCFA